MTHVLDTLTGFKTWHAVAAYGELESITSQILGSSSG